MVEKESKWEVIKIPKRGYGATKKYRWRHFELQKSKASNQGWYLVDNKWNIEYNQNAVIMDSINRLFWRHENSSKPRWQYEAKKRNYAIPFKSGKENDEFIFALRDILTKVAYEVYKGQISEPYSETLFINGGANYGFRRVKDAMRIAELIADFQDEWNGWGVINRQSMEV
jgi:hypothetical protein